MVVAVRSLPARTFAARSAFPSLLHGAVGLGESSPHSGPDISESEAAGRTGLQVSLLPWMRL